MTAPTTPARRSIASLKLPRAVPALVTYAQGVATCMTNNPAFPTPTPSLAVIQTAAVDLHTAELTAQNRTKGAVAARNEKRVVLVSLLHQVQSYVQAIADANLDNSASIIQSAGIPLRKVAVRLPRAFEAKLGSVSGTVKLAAPSAARRSAYEWQSSTDGGKTWVELPPTLQSRTTVTGIAAATTPQFRYRAVTKTGAADWSPPISILVR